MPSALSALYLAIAPSQVPQVAGSVLLAALPVLGATGNFVHFPSRRSQRQLTQRSTSRRQVGMPPCLTLRGVGASVAAAMSVLVRTDPFAVTVSFGKLIKAR